MAAFDDPKGEAMKLHYYGLIAGENKRVRPGRGGRFYQDPDYRTMLEGMTR